MSFELRERMIMIPIVQVISTVWNLNENFIIYIRYKFQWNMNCHLKLVQEILIPNVIGRLDHFTIDYRRRRLLFSCLGNNSCQIIDTFGGCIVNEIKDDRIKYPQGIYYCDKVDKIYIANGFDGKVLVYDADDLRYLQSIDFGDECDNLRFDKSMDYLWVSFGDGAFDAINVNTNERMNINIVLKHHPEGFQLESNGSRIFANITDNQTVVVIDRFETTGTKIIAEYKLPDNCYSNFPMYLDEASQLLFIGVRRPSSKLVVMNINNGSVAAIFPCCADMDDIFYDDKRQHIHIICGEGYVHSFQKIDNSFVDMGIVKTSIGARTGIWHDRRNQLYVAAPQCTEYSLGARLLVYEPQTI